MKEGQRKGGTGNEVEYREGKTWKNRERGMDRGKKEWQKKE